MEIDINALNSDVEVIGGEALKSGRVKITEKNTAYFISLLSNIYSNKIGSIVREITSNCFDAHVKGNTTDKPVVIRLYVDESNQEHIDFIDSGCGLSPIAMDEIYMSLGESDKRESNDFLGAFGLGSKSPLCYTPYFYLITKVDGLKYTYLINENVGGTTYDLLLTEPCESENGTTIRIPIVNSGDKISFEKEFKHGLKYFNNVIVMGFSSYNNDYKIKKFTNFQMREDLFLNKKNEDLHVCLGMVNYPIDWAAIGEKRIAFNAGLTFQIGDLDVILNREQLKYTPRTIQALKDKINSFKEELRKLIVIDENIDNVNLINYFDSFDKLKNNDLFKIKLDLQSNIKNDDIFLNLYEIPFIKKNDVWPKLIVGNQKITLETSFVKTLITRNSKVHLRSVYGQNLSKTGTDKFFSSKGSYSHPLFYSTNRKIVLIDENHIIKKHERLFFNDLSFEAVISFDYKSCIKALIKEIYRRNFKNISLSSNTTLNIYNNLKNIINRDSLYINGKTVESLNIAEDYGKDKKPKVVKQEGAVLFYEMNNSNSFDRSESLNIDKKFENSNYVFYTTYDSKYLLERIKSFLTLKTSFELINKYRQHSGVVTAALNISFIYCSKKYFKEFKGNKFINVEDFKKQKENHHFFKDVNVIKKINSFFNNVTGHELKNKYFDFEEISEFETFCEKIDFSSYKSIHKKHKFVFSDMYINIILDLYKKLKIIHSNEEKAISRIQLSEFLSEKYVKNRCDIILSRNNLAKTGQLIKDFFEQMYLELFVTSQLFSYHFNFYVGETKVEKLNDLLKLKSNELIKFKNKI